MIWIVGESDDHLEAAFTSREDAEACMAAQSGAHWWIAEIPLDPPIAKNEDLLRGMGGLSLAP